MVVLIDVSGQNSQCSSGAVLRLEELVETLQDRRRRMDQVFRPQPQSSEDVSRRDQSDVRPQESHLDDSEIFWSGDSSES